MTEWRREYSYDKVGNRTQLIKVDGAGSTTYTYAYNGLGQLESVTWTVSSDNWGNGYTYDANGNLTSKNTDKNSTTQTAWTYSWDTQDRLVAVVKDDQTVSDEDLRVEYKYCPMCGGDCPGNLVKRQTHNPDRIRIFDARRQRAAG